jgi:hypothetical protein
VQRRVAFNSSLMTLFLKYLLDQAARVSSREMAHSSDHSVRAPYYEARNREEKGKT